MRKLIILFVSLVCLLAQPALAEIGRIKNTTSGGVQVIRDGQTLRAGAGFRLEVDDIIVTGPRQRAGITFLDNTRMAVGPGSRVELTQYVYDRARQSGSSLITIQRGSLGVDSGNITSSGSDRMRVRTPTSTLGVRGTTFVVEVTE